MRYASKRSYNWSFEIAYSVGLMVSDGCLQKDGRHLDITSKDYEQLINFSAAIGRSLPISTKNSGKGIMAYRIQFSDVAYYDFLVDIGLTPVKSKTVGTLKIPDEYYAAFLRGLFDGDGSCYGYMDPRWRASFMFYIVFTSASPVFIQFIQDTNKRLVGTDTGSIRRSTRAMNLAYAKEDSHRLFDYLYRGSPAYCLTRKHQKLAEFVQRDRAGILDK